MNQEEKQKLINGFSGNALNFVVIVHEIANENVTSGGLDLSNAVDKNEKFRKGIVVSIGADCPKDFIKVGDEVLYDNYKTSELTLNAVAYKTLFFSDLTMVF